MNDDYNSMLTEKGAVDRAIEIEDRISEIVREIHYLEYRRSEQSYFGGDLSWFDDKLDDLESELSDLQEEYRG